MWVFSLLTSPYIGCGHVCASAFDSGTTTETINGRQYFSASIASGASHVRFSMTRTYSSPAAANVGTHRASGDYDFTQTSQELTTPTNSIQGQVALDWTSKKTFTSGSQVNNSPASAYNRQLLVRKLKTSQRENFYVSQCTSMSLFVGQKISDMTTV